MSPLDFTIWLKGFANAANPYNITPKQWDAICEQLSKVEIGNSYNYQVSSDSTSITNTTADVRYDVTYKLDELTTNTVF